MTTDPAAEPNPARRGSARSPVRAPAAPEASDPLARLERDPALTRFAGLLAAGRAAAAVGSAGSSTHLAAAALAKRTRSLVLLVVAHLDSADEAVDELTALGLPAARLPALEVLPGESRVSLDLFAERLSIIGRLRAGDLAPPAVLVAPIHALMQRTPEPARLDELMLTLAPGDDRGPEEITRWLSLAGYNRLDSVEEPGDFAVRGGIVDVFPPSADADGAGAVRLDFFGDELESIHAVDLATMGSDRRLDRVELIGAATDQLADESATVETLDLIPDYALPILAETLEITEQGRGYFERVTDGRTIVGPPAVFKKLLARFPAMGEINQFDRGSSRTTAAPADAEPIDLPVRPLPEFARDAADAVAELAELTRTHDVAVQCRNDAEASRLRELIDEFAPGAPIAADVRYLHRGFVWHTDDPDENTADKPLALVPHHELLHRYGSRRRIRRLRSGKAAETFLELEQGDYVVHEDHGVARFTGLKAMKPRAPRATAKDRTEQTLAKAKGDDRDDRPTQEYLTLEFAGRTKLHVPVTQIDKVQKYIGGFHGKPPLSTLGGKKWEHQKERVKESVRDLAAELLRVQAAREHMPGVRFPDDTPWQREFEAEFPYDETDDQLAALSEIKKDMTAGRPMDRLLCGDVGYGKTELAIRAAFKAVEFGKQAAVLVPTTILAEQHERTFRERFADYPFTVESLSRFKSRKDQNNVLMRTRKGQVDILVGTHRLLSKDVRFADLGIVIVDEEQRFGVEHKQQLLQLRLTADVLTLSATPIPRTLHMSMLGLRDISSLSTPPLDRRAVVTEVIPYNEKRIAQAIRRELSRDGQVFFVHNRVHNIKTVADDVQRLAPDARIAVGHGQMPTHELEDVMTRFLRREVDVLVSTTIIESGLDIPTANTMIINNADHFGLAELHQLRGRVGRYKHRAYCYLLLPKDRPLTEVATRRLRAIEEFSMLGAGFKIAMRDLEIRGAGNLLGPEQSGHIAAVGYDMYCRLLDQAARELKQERSTEPSATTVEIGLTGSIPKPYIPADARRLEAYRRIASARTHDELEQVAKDLTDAYTQPPEPTRTLLDLADLRVAAHHLGVRSIAVYERDVIFRAEDPAPVETALEDAPGTVRTLSDRTDDGLAETYFRPPESFLEPPTLLRVLTKRLRAQLEQSPQR